MVIPGCIIHGHQHLDIWLSHIPSVYAPDMSRLFNSAGHMRDICGTYTGHPSLYRMLPKNKIITNEKIGVGNVLVGLASFGLGFDRYCQYFGIDARLIGRVEEGRESPYTLNQVRGRFPTSFDYWSCTTNVTGWV